MATLAAQTVVRAGLAPSYSSCAAGGDEFVNTGKEFIHLKNGHTSAQTVTIETTKTIDGLAVADRDVEVPASGERMIGPFPTATYNDGENKAQLTYDGVVSLTIAVFDPGS